MCVTANRLRVEWYRVSVQIYPSGKLADEHLSALETDRRNERSQAALQALREHVASCEDCQTSWEAKGHV